MASAVTKPMPRMSPREAVRVLRHHLHGIGAVGPEYPHRPRRADAVAVQEHHDLADDLLLSPGVGDPLRPHPADAGHLAQLFRLRLDDIEHLLAKRPHKLAGVDRADAPDHARRNGHQGRLRLDEFAYVAIVDVEC